MRSVGITYLIWFLAPALGIHRLYCGRIGTGLLWCFTGGLLGIGWLVDLFLIPSLVREANLREPPLFNPRHYDRSAAAHAPPPPAHGNPQAHVGVAPAHRVIYCTHCGSPMQVPAGAIGHQYACPRCRTILEVPA